MAVSATGIALVKYPAGYRLIELNCTLIMLGVTTTRPWSDLVADRNWSSMSSCFAPAGTSMWKAKTSTGSRVQFSRLPFARMISPASFSISPRGECAPGSHLG